MWLKLSFPHLKSFRVWLSRWRSSSDLYQMKTSRQHFVFWKSILVNCFIRKSVLVHGFYQGICRNYNLKLIPIQNYPPSRTPWQYVDIITLSSRPNMTPFLRSRFGKGRKKIEKLFKSAKYVWLWANNTLFMKTVSKELANLRSTFLYWKTIRVLQ